MQALAVFIGNECLPKIQGGEDRVMVRRVGNARMVQPCDEITELLGTLDLRLERKTAPTVNPFV